jgi:type I restriction enzyme M protein
MGCIVLGSSVHQKLWKSIEGLVSYGDHYKVFDDFLTVVLSMFTIDPSGEIDGQRKRALKTFEKKEKELNDAITTLIYSYKDGMEPMGWFDPLGDLYMEIASRWKCSAMGQFFTPEPVCTMMAKITGCHPYSTVNDPCCGSGRMGMATKAIEPRTLFYMEDLDALCCKMTAINMLFHAMDGEVICHNSLDPNHKESFRHGYRISMQSVGEEAIPVCHYLSMYEMSDFRFRSRTIKAQKEEWLKENTYSNAFLDEIESEYCVEDFFKELEAMGALYGS